MTDESANSGSRTQSRKIKSKAKIDFGRLLKSLRIKSDTAWTQASLAEALGTSLGTYVSLRTYKSWEIGEAIPPPEYLKQIVDLLDLNKADADALYRAALQPPPIIDNLPFQPNPFFTGREEELKQIRKQLHETGTATITQPISKSINISGLGGIGKTELALEYAHRYYPDVYRVALWVNSADEDTLQASYNKLAEVLKLPERNEQNQHRRIQAVKDWLKMHTNWLLIMDNADDLPLAESFLPAKPLGHVLFTTRSQSIGTTTTRSNHIEVKEMESDDGLFLLLLRSDKLDGRTKLNEVPTDILETAREVVELLGGYPLALDQAGAYIQGTGVSFTDYIQRYRKERRNLLDRRSSRKSKDSEHSRHPLTVAATLDLSIKEACEGHPLATKILNFCAFLQPDAIPEELFQHHDSFKYGTTEFDEAIEALHNYSLIKRNTQEKTLSLHRLVQAVLIDDTPQDIQRQWRELVLQAVDAAFPEPDHKEWRQCERLLPHVLVSTTWLEDELTPTLEDLEFAQKTELLWRSGHYLRTQGQYAEAKTHIERSLFLNTQRFGAEHPSSATIQSHLAFLNFEQSNYEQSELLLEQALVILERELGTDHPLIVYMQCCLGVSYIALGKYEQAEELYERVLDVQEKVEEAEHPDTNILYYPLALFNAALGGEDTVSDAESFLQQSLTIEEKNWESDNIAYTLYALAILQHDKGKHDRGEALFQRALRIWEQQYETTHLVI